MWSRLILSDAYCDQSSDLLNSATTSVDVIVWLLWSKMLAPKVITLSGFHYYILENKLSNLRQIYNIEDIEAHFDTALTNAFTVLHWVFKEIFLGFHQGFVTNIITMDTPLCSVKLQIIALHQQGLGCFWNNISAVFSLEVRNSIF